MDETQAQAMCEALWGRPATVDSIEHPPRATVFNVTIRPRPPQTWTQPLLVTEDLDGTITIRRAGAVSLALQESGWNTRGRK